MSQGCVCHSSKCKKFCKFAPSLLVMCSGLWVDCGMSIFHVLVGAILVVIWKKMSASRMVTCSYWLLFGLVSVILSVIVSIFNSLFTEVSVLNFGLELVDIVNHTLLNWKDFKIVIVIVSQRVHCYRDDVMIPEWNSAILTFWINWWTYYKFERNLWIRIRLSFVGPIILATYQMNKYI